MEAATQQKIDKWLNGNYDQAVKDEILELQKSDPGGLEDAFYKDLEFGTGGLRGIMGIGTNRMNKYTVGMATQGYANYLKQCFQDEISVAIAYDCRNNSRFLLRSQQTFLQPTALKFICLKPCAQPRN